MYVSMKINFFVNRIIGIIILMFIFFELKYLFSSPDIMKILLIIFPIIMFQVFVIVMLYYIKEVRIDNNTFFIKDVFFLKKHSKNSFIKVENVFFMYYRIYFEDCSYVFGISPNLYVKTFFENKDMIMEISNSISNYQKR